jgi:hypothetical protein
LRKKVENKLEDEGWEQLNFHVTEKWKPLNLSDLPSRMKQSLGGKKELAGIRGNLLTWQVINPVKLIAKGSNGSCHYPNVFKE